MAKNIYLVPNLFFPQWDKKKKKKIHNLQILLKWFFHITELEYKEGQKNCALYRKDKLNDLRPFAEVW